MLLLAGLAGLAGAVLARPVAAATAPVTAGTDVSNGSLVGSWPDVKAAGMTFTGVMTVDGATVTNSEYNAEVTGALAAGLFVMPYVVADPLRVGGADQFTKKAWPVIKGIAASPYRVGGAYLPIALDLESQPKVTPKECYGLTPAQMIGWINAFINAARSQAHVTPVIYTSASWWQDCTGAAASFGGAPLWVADYGVATPAIPAGWAGYTFWQSSGTATINGIAGVGQADLDQFEGAVTGKAATSGSFQVRTLSSLAGGSVSYSAVRLPKGVSLSSSGKLSWTKATPVGALTVTVATTGTPATVNLTLLMHAPITIATAKRSSTVGRTVKLQVTASGTDEKHGFAPTLKATGLPPGLKMNGSGLVTGKPAKAGSWAVKVTATDNLDGTGSATFTWTIKKG
jgi:GH25 family lysozyme M1 (1,4-beta-N-acetylmuramidase)